MTSGQVIDAYLGEVADALPGPPRARADIVAELRGGLLDAADAHRSAGLATATAVGRRSGFRWKRRAGGIGVANAGWPGG